MALTDTDVKALGFPRTSVIVVTHQSVRDVPACLDSLFEHARGEDCEVIVVDNASDDGTYRLVRERYPWVRLLVASKRRGFAENCNAGAAEARGTNLFFLNPDARVREGAIGELVGVLETDPSVAVVGPSLVYPDGSPQASARRFPTLRGTLVRRTPLRWMLRNSVSERRHLMLVDARGDGRPASGPARRPRQVDWLLGAAIAMRSEDYRKLGGMDVGYRLYCEDIDLCWRAWESGRKVVQAPDAVVEHDLSELTRKRFLTRATLWHFRSMARFVVLHGLRPPRLARAE